MKLILTFVALCIAQTCAAALIQDHKEKYKGNIPSGDKTKQVKLLMTLQKITKSNTKYYVRKNISKSKHNVASNATLVKKIVLGSPYAGELVEIDSKTYYFGEEQIPRDECQKKCEEMGMELGSLESSEEFYAIYNYLARFSNYYYNSFWSSGKANRLDWYWHTTNGTIPFTDESWDTLSYQPDDMLNYPHDCMHFSAKGVKWDDTDCNEPNYLFCEQID